MVRSANCCEEFPKGLAKLRNRSLQQYLGVVFQKLKASRINVGLETTAHTIGSCFAQKVAF